MGIFIEILARALAAQTYSIAPAYILVPKQKTPRKWRRQNSRFVPVVRNTINQPRKMNSKRHLRKNAVPCIRC